MRAYAYAREGRLQNFLHFSFLLLWGWTTSRRFMNSDVSFYEKWRVVLWKVTCCFMKSDVSFYEKWRVVLWKVTCRFMRSDVSFYEKWRVVLWEMTCCFMRNDVLFCKRYLNIKPILAGNDKQTARPNKNSHILGKIWEFLSERYSKTIASPFVRFE